MIKDLEAFFKGEFGQLIKEEAPKKKRAKKAKEVVVVAEPVVEPVVIVGPDPLKPVYDKIEEMRTCENGGGISRFGYFDKDECIKEWDTVCFASLKYHKPKVGNHLFVVWNGEPADGRTTMYGNPNDTDRDYPHKRKPGFEPGPMSDRWLDFLMGDLSPWKAIHPYLVTTDVGVIRNTGFIFNVTADLNMDLLYNFLIATRYVYEFNRRGEFWYKLVEEHKVDPRAAFLITISFVDEVAAREKKLVRKGGKRKDETTGKYIMDHWGDPRIFPDEYEDIGPIPVWDGKLRRIMGDNHTPLNAMSPNIRRIMSCDPVLIKENTLLLTKTRGMTWDMWVNAKEIKFPDGGAKPTLDIVLAFIQETIGEAQKKAA